MKLLITLGAMVLALAATDATRTYQYKDMSAKTARPYPEEQQVKEKKSERTPAEHKAQELNKPKRSHAKEIR